MRIVVQADFNSATFFAFSNSYLFLQCDVVFTVRASDFSTNGVRRKLDVFFTKVAGHFQETRLTQLGFLLTVRAGDFLSKIASRKGDVSATMDAESF
jgi:hypothetical protein